MSHKQSIQCVSPGKGIGNQGDMSYIEDTFSFLRWTDLMHRTQFLSNVNVPSRLPKVRHSISTSGFM